MDAQRFDQLPADAHHRVQREFRILHDHGDAFAADAPHLPLGEAEDIRSLQRHPARLHLAGRADEAQDGAACHRLARA
jgi:hypothetical protein